jgi:hypothetical protein
VFVGIALLFECVEDESVVVVAIISRKIDIIEGFWLSIRVGQI